MHDENANMEQSVCLPVNLEQEVGAQFVGICTGGDTMPLTLKERERQRELFYTCECMIASCISD